jgi:2-phosphosulfolactate phosphatase
VAVVDVAFDPRQAAPGDLAVVIDCIRATSTIAQALASGYERVVCVGEIPDAEAERGAGVVLGGERHGVRIEGFDLGNSPAEYTEARGHTLVLTTTNGTRAILQAVGEADGVLVAALTCVGAVAERIAATLPAEGRVGIRCAGVRGDIALDDAYVAGVLVERLIALRGDLVPQDGARMALALTRAYPDAATALGDSQSARDLDGTGLEPDVARCARVDTLTVVPQVLEAAPGRVVVGV